MKNIPNILDEHFRDLKRPDEVGRKAVEASLHKANQEAIVPIGIAAAAAGALFLGYELFMNPTEPRGGSAWWNYIVLFSFLLAFGAFLLILYRIPRIRPHLPVAAAISITLLTSGLASADSLVSRDMSALAIGLVGGTIALRTRIPFHLLRDIATIALYIGGVRILAGHFPAPADIVNSVVQLILAMLVAFILERYALRASLYQAKLEERNRELLETAIRDRLTGLYNRHYTDETLDRSFAVARTRGKQLSLILIDVDHFKRINDEFGHDEGDRVLVATANALAVAVGIPTPRAGSGATSSSSSFRTPPSRSPASSGVESWTPCARSVPMRFPAP